MKVRKSTEQNFCNHDIMNNKTVVMRVNIHQVGEMKEIIK